MPPPDAAAVWTALFCRILPPAARRIAMESTAAGIDADTVMPANMPRYALAAPSTAASTEPRMKTPTVSSGKLWLAGMYGTIFAAAAADADDEDGGVDADGGAGVLI